jgi:ribosome-binding factor A
MAQGSRPQRIADQIRAEIGTLLARGLKDPGIGFVTVTAVRVTADLQLARVFYTTLGDDRARRETARALARALPFLRRQVAQRLRLRRAPELVFQYDETIEKQDRVEQLLREIRDEADRAGRSTDDEPHD